MIELLISAMDYADREIDPNGSFRIFGIGTKVEILKTGEIGIVTKIGRRTLTVKVAGVRRFTRAFYPYELEITNRNR
jgi:hypothetical protein